MKSRLFTPGPTPVPGRVARRMAQPVINHRGQEFRELMAEVTEGLQYVFRTYDPVFTLTGSGTSAMEAAIVNTLSPGDEIVHAANGKFAERWGVIARAYGVTAHPVETPWGQAPDVDAVLVALERYPNAVALCLNHSETSTGVLTDVQAIAEAIRPDFDGLLMVDGVSSVAATEFRFEEWEIDVAITASQKALMLPPGLAFIALSRRAWTAAAKSTLPKFYFDLTAARQALKAGATPWTPAISLVAGAAESLQMIREEEIEHVWTRHRRLGEAFRRGIAALGLHVFGSPHSDTVTAVRLPDRGGQELIGRLKREYNVVVAGGQGELERAVFRVGHMGYCDEGDIHALLTAIGGVLEKQGSGNS